MKHLVIDEKIEYCNQCVHYNNVYSYCKLTGSYTRLKQARCKPPYTIEIPDDCPLEDKE